MVLRVLNKILEVPKDSWGPFGQTKLILVTLRDRDTYECGGVTFGGNLAKMFSIETRILLNSSKF